MSVEGIAITMLAILGAGFAGASACAAYALRKRSARLRESALKSVVGGDPGRERATRPGSFALDYAERLTRELYAGSTMPLLPSVRAKRADKTRAGKSFIAHREAAGCATSISVAAYCETRARLGCVGMCFGLAIGALVSTELGLLLGAVGAFFGFSLPSRGVAAARKQRTSCAEEHLSEMLEVVSLGLRSGLTFDRSFALYGAHFESEFARSCALAYRRWSLGLSTREEALRSLARSFECDQLKRVVESVVRGLRFGSPLATSLDEAAVQARATWKAKLSEKVAKAPVKMMLPTGVLILPAMLLLVMGPILLELASGF